MKRSYTKVKKPNALLFYTVYFLAKIFYRIFYRLSVDKSAVRNLKPPFVVVANHGCWLDYMITGVSMYPWRTNYVAAFNFFRYPHFKLIFGLMGVISKYQFTNDPIAIKKMLYVIKRQGILTLFPYGCLSNEGRPGGFMVYSIAKLVKHLMVPVVGIRTEGGYLTRPRWTKKSRRGRIEVRISPLLDKFEIQKLSEEQIYNRIKNEIDFDDYKWQREKMIPFRGSNLAEGVEYVLYKCPECEKEFTLRSKGNRLFCISCGNSVIMNQFGFFEPGNKGCKYFEGIDSWYDYQKQCIEEELENPLFELQAETELRWAQPGKYGYQYLGKGILKLNDREIVYEGTINKENTTRTYPMKNIIMVPYAAGEYFEIAKGSDINRFILKDPMQQIKWVMCIRQIRDKYYERIYEKDEKGWIFSKSSI